MQKTVAAPQITDHELVTRVIDGDRSAFMELYFRHARYVAGVAGSIIGRDSEIEDIVQETFLQAHRSIATLRERDKVRPWLATIAVRKVYRVLKKRKQILFFPVPPEETPAHAQNEENLVLRNHLYLAMGSLTPELRIPWVLFKVEGMKLPEVAELCEASVATIKRRIAKATEKLQKRLHHG